jgi:hypothetical protein
MSAWAADGRTDWEGFMKSRDASYSALSSHCHELIAQAITYCSISQIPDGGVAARLKEVFGSLEDMQPPHYRLSPDIKHTCQYANWPLVLRAARGEVVKHNNDTFALEEGIAALITKTAHQGAASNRR